MKTAIFILVPISQSTTVTEIKEQIVKYLGSRMIEHNPDDIPALAINCSLDPEDKNAIVSSVTSRDDRSCVIFLETDKELNSDYFVFSF